MISNVDYKVTSPKKAERLVLEYFPAAPHLNFVF